jgi:hypothetical protein
MAINNNINCDNKEYYFGGGLRNKDSIKRNCCNSCPNSKNRDSVKYYQWWEVVTIFQGNKLHHHINIEFRGKDVLIPFRVFGSTYLKCLKTKRGKM